MNSSSTNCKDSTKTGSQVKKTKNKSSHSSKNQSAQRFVCSKPMNGVLEHVKTPQDVLHHMRSKGSKIFSVVFKRRTEKRDTDGHIVPKGAERHMLCRLHVRKGVKGVEPNRWENDAAINCVTVYEMRGKESGFKRIPLDSVIAIDGDIVELEKQDG
jgi:hypothetical protein